MKIRINHFKQFKDQHQKFACLTSYDMLTAGIFDAAEIPLILVGDSAADNVLGYDSTAPITLEELVPFARAVRKGAKNAFVVADLPFGSYEVSPAQAIESAIKLVKLSGVDAVKLEGGATRTPQIQAITGAGIPVMAHIGFTPQTIAQMGGYKVQGRNPEAAASLIEDARAVQDAGAFAVVLELVPAALATEVTEKLSIPTVGIGAGSGTDGQILVWSDMAGLRQKVPKFVRQYLALSDQLTDAVRIYKDDVASGDFPNQSESYE